MTSAPATLDRCRVCGNASLIPCASLGAQYPSAMFPDTLDYRATVPQLPLDLVMCDTGDATDVSHCGLVQLGHVLDLRGMYDAYPYTSATNSSMPFILHDVAESGLAFGHLAPGDVVLDIGANDGTLLACFRGRAVELVGIDPAKNVTPVFLDPRYTHVRSAFDRATYASVTTRKAKLVFSVAMFYHLHDPVAFARDVAACLDEDGVWIIQMAYLPSMLRTNMYDNIVHEHQGYYGASQMAWIMDHVGLEVFDVTLNDVYGGSFRGFVKHQGCRRYPTTARYQALRTHEREEGIFALATYQAFMRRIEGTREALRGLCQDLGAQRKTLWVYGASTKGNTILQYVGLRAPGITAAADANPFKLGKYMIGSDIPIRDEASMRAARPDYLLVLPYSFLDGFMRREAGLLAQGTQFIVPLPDVQLVPGLHSSTRAGAT